MCLPRFYFAGAGHSHGRRSPSPTSFRASHWPRMRFRPSWLGLRSMIHNSAPTCSFFGGTGSGRVGRPTTVTFRFSAVRRLFFLGPNICSRGRAHKKNEVKQGRKPNHNTYSFRWFAFDPQYKKKLDLRLALTRIFVTMNVSDSLFFFEDYNLK